VSWNLKKDKVRADHSIQ